MSIEKFLEIAVSGYSNYRPGFGGHARTFLALSDGHKLQYDGDYPQRCAKSLTYPSGCAETFFDEAVIIRKVNISRRNARLYKALQIAELSERITEKYPQPRKYRDRETISVSSIGDIAKLILQALEVPELIETKRDEAAFTIAYETANNTYYHSTWNGEIRGVCTDIFQSALSSLWSELREKDS